MRIDDIAVELSGVKQFALGGVKELTIKVATGILVSLAGAIDDAGPIIILFCWLLIGDMLLGTLQSIRTHGFASIRPWRWVTGPAIKGVVMSIFLVMAAMLDTMLNHTPAAHVMTSPVVVGAGCIGCAAIVMDAARKVDTLTGLGIGKWLAENLPIGKKS